ncbi:tail fiber domain-containing protein [Dyadobacter sp. CY343]|uniref:tail fiber domain-containing protein n=1 Tax=Dyadobacter sp. CY343 TaxID=2907299 RepID=UPI001F28AA59|nr:tail fiber domain-containing protein [Dyadobacter sp. CY343]MCE7063486.1 tail fiber domain-containing protein [Dyadobacter sp. CY343]
MKSVSLSLLILLSSKFLAAQAPEQFSFQGVARGADGNLVKNVVVRLRVTIHSENITGPAVYQENHRPLTNENGIFTIAIGKGIGKSGNFEEIPWKAQEQFIQLEMDPTGGNALVDLGTTQLLSVPYALQAKAASHWNHGLPVVQSMVLEPGLDPIAPAPNDPKLQKYLLPTIGDGYKLIWYPIKGAFRVGYSSAGKWEDNLMGSNSFATGTETEASGAVSAAFGSNTKALGSYSLATGFNSEAAGYYSSSFGVNTAAYGDMSTAFGYFTRTKTKASFVAGLYNNFSDQPDPAIDKETDRIFQIGNGSIDARKNALTVLRNGNLGLGEFVLKPTRILDIGGRPRIRHDGATAGIFLDNSQNTERAFVGMKTDDEVGFFMDTWQLWVNNQGNAYLRGNVSLTSDARLKYNLSPLSGSLRKVNDLTGYNYNWIDPARDQSMQTGLVAQEVEKLFPELVQTDDKGFKSVNYIGLIPHLIESVKQLTKENEALKTSNSSFEGRLQALEAANTVKTSGNAK